MENTATPVKKTGWTSIPVAGAIGVVYADKTGVSTPNTSMPYLTWYDSNVSHTPTLAIGDDGGIQVSTNVASMKLVVDV